MTVFFLSHSLRSKSVPEKCIYMNSYIHGECIGSSSLNLTHYGSCGLASFMWPRVRQGYEAGRRWSIGSELFLRLKLTRLRQSESFSSVVSQQHQQQTEPVRFSHCIVIILSSARVHSLELYDSLDFPHISHQSSRRSNFQVNNISIWFSILELW